MKSECIFCKIVQGETQSYKIWEDENYLAFLSIYPNTDGATVVVPKRHLTSDIFEQANEDVISLMLATKKVAGLLRAGLENVGRVGLVFEGFEVDHLHAKLYPMHGTKSDSWEQKISHIDKFFTHYEGYISSHECHKATAKDLELIQKKIIKG